MDNVKQDFEYGRWIRNMTGVIKDPLGLTHSLISNEWALFWFAGFWKVGTDMCAMDGGLAL